MAGSTVAARALPNVIIEHVIRGSFSARRILLIVLVCVQSAALTEEQETHHITGPITVAACATFVLCLLIAGSLRGACAQSLGNTGTVMDASGAAIPKASVTLHNPLTSYTQSATSAEDGSFRLVNIPPNPYHLEVTAPGSAPFAEDIDVRNSLPLQINSRWPASRRPSRLKPLPRTSAS
jgi:hypothetical protein